MKIENSLHRLEKDFTSGSYELGLMAIEILLDYLELSNKDWRKNLPLLCRRLVGTKPDMATLLNISHLTLLESERKNSSKENVKRTLFKMKSDLKDSVKKIGEVGQSLLSEKSVLMTHSRSKTVFTVIQEGVKRGVIERMYVTQSYPLGEGIIFSREIKKLGIETLLIPDSSMGPYLPRCDFVLLGGDALTEKYLVNKVGSLPLALLSRYTQKPLYCALDTFKFIPSNLYSLREGKNSLFEPVPLSLISNVITEEGVINRGDVKKNLQSIIEKKWKKRRAIGLLKQD